MDWSREPWIKLYVRDEPSFLALSWQARGLFRLILTQLQRNTGSLHLGKPGLRSVALSLRAPWDEVEAPLRELLDDGCLTVSGEYLTAPNFIAAQTVRTGDRLRKQMQREREQAAQVSETPQDVTAGHSTSHDVTNRIDKNRIEKKPPLVSPLADSGTEPGATAPSSAASADVSEVFEFWASHVWRRAHQRRPKRTKERLSRIRARLREGYTAADLKAALAQAAKSNWHLGENDRGQVYIDLQTLIGTADKVDRWLAAAERPSARTGQDRGLSARERRDLERARQHLDHARSLRNGTTG